MEKPEGKFKLSKITNPEFLGALNKEIIKLADKVGIPGITHQTLWTYFYQSIQRSHLQEQSLGKTNEEFWVVYTEVGNKEENLPPLVHAFAHWYKKSLPDIGKVYCDWMYSWQTSKMPVQLLIDKFLKFGETHHCPWYEYDAINERVYTVLKKAADKKGGEISRQARINCIGRKK